MMSKSTADAAKRRKLSAPITKNGNQGNPLEERLSKLYTSLSGTSDLNPLVDLIDLLRDHLAERKAAIASADQDLKTLHKAVHFLVRSIQTLLKQDRIPISSVNEAGVVVGGDEHLGESERAVAQWLQSRWNDTIMLLCSLLHGHDVETRRIALRLLMALQRDASSSLARRSSAASTSRDARGQWANTPWKVLCRTLIAGSFVSGTQTFSPVPEDVIQAFTDDYLQEYDDVRFAFCRQVAAMLQETPKDLLGNQKLRGNAIQFFWGLSAIPKKLDDLNTYMVSELNSSRRMAQKQEKAVKSGDDSDAEQDVEDWFSDSEEEGSRKITAKRADKGAGLGKAAQAAAEGKAARKRLRRNPPFADAVHSLNAQKAAYSRAWLSILLPKRDVEGKVIGGALDLAATHEALMRLHSQILPHLVKPNLLHDFLVDALDTGGATSLLALNGLFTLMTSHNLNYPAFYTRLYALLLADPPVLHVRYRSRFLRLLDVFLSSTHLSATLVASFAKRLSRIALRAPPAAIVVVIPFVWNLCKRHKPCMGLIHREFGGDRFNQGPAGLPDPYDALETDPLKTSAIDSSLWELAAMGSTLASLQQYGNDAVSAEGQAHYLASVASISRILAEPFTKERYDLEDFLDLTYSTLFETETKKTLQKREGRKVVEPAVVFDLPRSADRKRLPTFVSGQSKRLRVGADGEGGANGEDEAEADGVNEEESDICNRLFTF